MADDLGDRVRHWPLEGHFVVGGSGLYVETDCVGCTFASRTANHDLIIGLPQVDVPNQYEVLLRSLENTPAAIQDPSLCPPDWVFGPRNEDERTEEKHISPVWGTTFGVGAEKVYPESARDTAVVVRCRFYTTVVASDVDEFDSASEDFLRELDEWWARFTSWVGVLTGQDFVGLGGYPGGATRSRAMLTWTGDVHGQRDRAQYRRYFPPPPCEGFSISTLRLEDLEACVTATGQDSPPAEWVLIRDARALLNAGHIRRAVLDAGTAAELAMAILVDKYLGDARADDAVKKAITESYDNLGAMTRLLGWLRPKLLPAAVQSDLIQKRNMAIHGRSKSGKRWDEITAKEARKAVEIATQIVESAHPLAMLLTARTPE